jgi:hypothetical protein
MSYRSTKMDPAPVINYAPPIAWLDHHSAEGGVRCDELKRREDESAAEAEQDRAEEIMAAFREIAREQF